MGTIRMLRIEVDGHFHGGPPPRPWVAQITGTDERYGLRREFVRALNDWADAHAAWSGNVYGVIATFPLRRGNLYEVSRTRGKPSKRYIAREFVRVGEDGKLSELEPVEALALVEGDAAPATILRVSDDRDAQAWVAEVAGLGTPRRLGWVVVDGKRHYRLRPGRVYEVREGSEVRFARVGDDSIAYITEQEALRWLRAAG